MNNFYIVDPIFKDRGIWEGRTKGLVLVVGGVTSQVVVIYDIKKGEITMLVSPNSVCPCYDDGP